VLIFNLLKYFFSLSHWEKASVESIEEMQVRKFRDIFEYAVANSKFYNKFYKEHGVLSLKIEKFEDIRKVPIIDKDILRKYSMEDIMTCDISKKINIHSTSGSTGEPFKISFNKYEDYTSHVRVYWALKKAGYSLTDKIIMVTRYDPNHKFEVEKDVSVLNILQRRFNVFRREVISIFDSADDIISKLEGSSAKVLWSTPSIMQIIANRLVEKGKKFQFQIIFLTSEVISPILKDLFISHLGKNIVNLYGSMESPSIGFDIGLNDHFTLFPNSNCLEVENHNETVEINKNGNVIITNLINKTFPIIRYNLNDLVEIENNQEFSPKYIKKIIGRRDDIIDLPNGVGLAHHHVAEMFMDFHECEMYKFIQKKDKTVHLQLMISPKHDKLHVSNLAAERWRKRFGDMPLSIDIVQNFMVNPKTGKFKNIEVE
jgi:phenylacetate-CoA ligase